MRISPKPVEIGPNDGFTANNDIFGYEEFGKRLGNLMRNIDHPATILLDGPWGSGKSVFAQQWAGQCRNEGAKVIYFDAFKNDFHSDAFMAITSQIINIVQKEDIGTKTEQKSLISKSVQLGKELLPIAAKIGTRAATFGLLDTEIFEGAGEAIDATTKEVGKQFEEAFEKKLREKLTNAQTEEKTVIGFREQLETIAAKARTASKQEGGEDNQGWPLIFIIDELDRCKPSFALEVIENIKHLFAVDNVCFLIVTNTTHLEDAISGLYGLKAHKSSYLNKFYDQHFKLPEQKNTYNSVEKYCDFIWRQMEFPDDERDQIYSAKNTLKTVSCGLSLSIRDVSKVVGNLSILALSGPENNIHNLSVYMAILKLKNHDLYEKIKTKTVDLHIIITSLNINNWNETERVKEYHQDFWSFIYGAELIDERRREHFDWHHPFYSEESFHDTCTTLDSLSAFP
ncbi:P-loop NTPase fold protein [Kordiimonas sp. SCSIO 12610]|uniref:KAP family P-loop NTPase fold protein n=1 Tax=Kordiimonas sp. SCSIO 12610 TaxID=2829597 RepID=UPI0021092DBF|nr:P-loop NTPase fold protein [Kordiimonas sp. SCSIO 12610]UTW56085.1 hypothetical protein KFF44_04105 [Kordiimonas sp. SCSIO 12610]